MLSAQTCSSYNEVIVSTEAWDDALPHTIEAVVFADEAARGRARSVHRSFLQQFARTAVETPLLQLDWTGVCRAEGCDWGTQPNPFREASWD